MTLSKLEQVLWYLRQKHDRRMIKNRELQQAIMVLVGTDPRTYKKTRKALVTLGWITSRGNKRVLLTNKDITG